MPKCNKDQIVNPSTGRCVKKTGKIGKELLKMNVTNYIHEVLKKKTSVKKSSVKKVPARKVSSKKELTHKASNKKDTSPNALHKKESFDNVVVWVKPILVNPQDFMLPINDENIKLIAKSYKDHLTILQAIWDGWKLKSVKINEDNKTISINIEVYNIDYMDAVEEDVVPIYNKNNDTGFLMIADVWTYVTGGNSRLKLNDTHPNMYIDLTETNPDYLEGFGDDVNILAEKWVGYRI